MREVSCSRLKCDCFLINSLRRYYQIMHRTSVTTGECNLQSEDVTFVEQTPATVVLITAADTEIQTVAAALPKLPATFPQFRVAKMMDLQHQISIDAYAEQVLEFAKVIILRLLGGRSYWAYGLEVISQIVERKSTNLIVMPGDDALDAELIAHSTLPLAIANQVWRYFNEGGADNIANALMFISDKCLSTSFNPPPPKVVPRVGFYRGLGTGKREQGIGKIPVTTHQSPLTAPRTSHPAPQSPLTAPRTSHPAPRTPIPKIPILFYRAHYLAGNTKVIDALCEALVKRNLEPIPIFVSSLRDLEVQAELSQLFEADNFSPIKLLLNTTSFSLAKLNVEKPQVDLWKKLNVPILQVILSSAAVKQWESGIQGLSPRDIAMNVALPEVDGRIITRAVSFKALQSRNSNLETDVMVYQPESSRIEFVADLAANWVRLSSKPPQERRVALILANYPTRDGRLANGVGLDTPASCVEILKAMEFAGYRIDNIPQTGTELIECLTKNVTNDLEGRELRPVAQGLCGKKYAEYFLNLPLSVQTGISQRWGLPKEEEEFPVSGMNLGNVFVGIQPARGYDLDPSLNYHAPDLEPTHDYLAFYYWIRECFAADAIIHVGKHGNLEWLPGKSLALSENCYPEVALGALPHFYPFIVNDPGEGSQAKRRASAVILDHLTPPLTRAELYGGLQTLENLIDEYHEAQNLDPSRLSLICDRIRSLVTKENLYLDLGIENDKIDRDRDTKDFANFDFSILNSLDGYLCELKEAQIRDGLHVFGQCPQGRQLQDLIIAIARHPNRQSPGLLRAITQDWGLDFDPFTADFATELSAEDRKVLAEKVLAAKLSGKTSHHCRNIGDAIEVLEQYAAFLVGRLIENYENHENHKNYRGQNQNIGQTTSKLTSKKTFVRDLPSQTGSSKTQLVLDWIESDLLRALKQTDCEIHNLLRGLDGKYIPSGPAGAPTRGRPEVLPTGNNFYSVDIRALPTETAWDVGRKAAETLIESYTQENGEYPKTLGLSVWGTSTMRTGGDDIAEALACLGVQPVWDGTARRVVDFEILPLSVLGRPRVDVTLRISGFFRDAFPNLVDLFDKAVTAVAALDEPPHLNPLATQVRQETAYWQKLGLTDQEAFKRSHYRIFGSKPGAYGAGLQGLIESQNWTDDRDLARAYMNWSGYAYTGKSEGRSAPEAFEQRLGKMEIVLHNQDNREHDLLDSDDYYQFQGGLTAAVRSISGKHPQIYFGDNSIPARPKIRHLKAEIAKVYRSRVVNPKWIAGVMRHGYKGAFEIAATVDYLFAYDATTHCVENYMYEGIANTYLFNSTVCDFIEQHNPHALRDIAERLLEAHKRSLWQDVNIPILENLRNLVHQAEAAIETK